MTEKLIADKDIRRIQTAEDIGMSAYQILGNIFLSKGTPDFTDDEHVIILDWFSDALSGHPIGDLNFHKPISRYLGQRDNE